MAIFSIVLFSVTIALNETFTVGLRNRRRGEAQEDMSAALEQISRGLRQAKSVTFPVASSSLTASSLTSIASPASGGAILQFTDISGNVVSYSAAAVPSTSAEYIAPVNGKPNYQIMVTSGSAGTPQPLTEQNITSFTAERPGWSDNVVIITLQSVQLNATGTRASPLSAMTMVTLRQ